MPIFAYDAVDAGGRAARGTRHAGSGAELAFGLETAGYTVIEYREISADTATRTHSGRPRASLILEALRSICSLLRAGLPLEKAITAASDASDERCRRVLLDIRDTIAQGSTVADGFARHARYFDAAAVGLIRSGELSGQLSASLEMLVALKEREQRLRSGILTAAIYPTILGVTSLIASVGVLVFVVPRFAEMIEGAGSELPLLTALLVAVSRALRRAVWWLAIAAPALIAAAVIALGTTRGRTAIHSMLAQIPIIGELRRSAAAARGARVAGSLTKAGIPLVDALAAAGDTLGHSTGGVAFRGATKRLREGARAGSAFDGDPFFPPVLSRLVRAGDGAGDIANFLLAAADALERHVEVTTRRIGIIIEPLVIVTFGGLIGFVAFALFQAIYGLNAGGVQ